MTAGLRIRPEEPADRDTIHALHRAAFGRDTEADLVDRLRRDGSLTLSLVADADRILGHIAFSRLTGVDPSVRVSALAPVGVLPEAQGQGVGSALIRQGLGRLADGNEDLVIVLGEPAYYGRFGFTAEAMQGLRTPYDGPFLQGLRLTDRRAGGEIRYAPAFADLA